MASKQVRIFQILYNKASARQRDPGFTPLLNLDNPRPDWSEYWPIRTALSQEAFDDDCYLGFFSPRFGIKTGIASRAVFERIAARDAEAYSFSPYFEMSALFLNPIEQGEFYHPGLAAACQELLPHWGLNVNLRTFVCDHRTTIFSNYIVAKARLWKRWLAMGEVLFTICEQAQGELAANLTASTAYARSAERQHPMKVFVMERMMSLLLEQEGLTPHYALDPRYTPRSIDNVDTIMSQLVVCDKIKQRYRETRDSALLVEFTQARDAAIRTLAPRQPHSGGARVSR